MLRVVYNGIHGIMWETDDVASVRIPVEKLDKLHADLKTAREWGRAASDSNKTLRDKIKTLEADCLYFLCRSLDAERELNLHKLCCEVYNGQETEAKIEYDVETKET